jgi:hypothetical protein
MDLRLMDGYNPTKWNFIYGASIHNTGFMHNDIRQKLTLFFTNRVAPFTYETGD